MECDIPTEMNLQLNSTMKIKHGIVGWKKNKSNSNKSA